MLPPSKVSCFHLGPIRYTATLPLGKWKSYRLDAVYQNLTCGMLTIQAPHQP